MPTGPAAAVDHDLVRAGKLVQAFRKRSARDQLRAGYPADRVLFRLAHVYEHKVITTIHLGFEL